MRRRLVALTALMVCGSASASQIYADFGRLTVRLHVYGTLKSAGPNGKKDIDEFATGFIVSPDGLVMTAGHVVPDPSKFEPDQLWVEGFLPLSAGTALKASADPQRMTIEKSASYPFDAGLLKFTGVTKPFSFLRLCDGTLNAGDKLHFLGYQMGREYLAEREASIETPAVDPDPLVIQVPLAPGDSGGPVFNGDGEVVAIGIGQLNVNGVTIESTNYAVLVRNAIAQLDPSTKELVGSSYDPDCGKQLTGKFSAPFSVEKDERVVVLSTGKVQSDKFTAPGGYVFADVDKPSIQASNPDLEGSISSSIVNSGKTLDVSSFLKPKSGSAIFGPINARVRKRLAYTLSPDPFAQSHGAVSPGPGVTAFVVELGNVAKLPYRQRIDIGGELPGLHADSLISAVILKDKVPLEGGVTATLQDDNKLDVTLEENSLIGRSPVGPLALLVTVGSSPRKQ